MANGSTLQLPGPGGYSSLNWGPLSNLGTAVPQQLPLGQLGQYLGGGTGAANPQFQSWFSQMFGGGNQQSYNPIAEQMEMMGYQPPGYAFSQEMQQRQQSPWQQPFQTTQQKPDTDQLSTSNPATNPQQQQKPDDDRDNWQQVSAFAQAPGGRPFNPPQSGGGPAGTPDVNPYALNIANLPQGGLAGLAGPWQPGNWQPWQQGNPMIAGMPQAPKFF